MNLLDVILKAGAFRVGSDEIQTGLDFSGPVKIGIRPEAIKTGTGIPAKVVWAENLGARFLVDTRIGEISLMVLSDERPPSDSISLHIEPKDIHVFDKDTGESLRCARNGDFDHPQSEDGSVAP
jgi:ABC-type sugar transport system ATPase subunit